MSGVVVPMFYVHVLSLEAMYQDEIGQMMQPTIDEARAHGLGGPLLDERWWRQRWLLEARADAAEIRAERSRVVHTESDAVQSEL